MSSHAKSKRCQWLKAIASLFFLLPVLHVTITPANAHKVIVFAWVEGDTVYTESKFSGGRKAKHAIVEVYDGQGNKLLDGKTDENGEFSFKIPKEAEMKVVLLAGTGHRGEWTIPIEEIQGVPRQPVKNETEAGKKSAASSGLSESDIERIVDTALDRKLKPLLRMLAESRTRGPSVSDIIGGIGYILGLVGLGAYVHYRRKKNG
jgi:nickel transport protein